MCTPTLLCHQTASVRLDLWWSAWLFFTISSCLEFFSNILRLSSAIYCDVSMCTDPNDAVSLNNIKKLCRPELKLFQVVWTLRLFHHYWIKLKSEFCFRNCHSMYCGTFVGYYTSLIVSHILQLRLQSDIFYKQCSLCSWEENKWRTPETFNSLW